MYCVYILQSIKRPTRYYKGYTTNLHNRLKHHNTTNSGHTAKYKPWKLIFYCVFQNQKNATQFEKYLKTASGAAFMKKRLINYYL
jgi:predicted GIY-YIG superfamily endonuclease